MNDERGDGAVELIPCVIGLSIPWPTNAMLWAIFTLAHFKPFSISTDLLTADKDLIACQAACSFCPRSLKVMKDWEAIHECEDVHDTERLCKHAQLTAKSNAMTASVAMAVDDDKLDFAFPKNSTCHSESDFRVQQAVLELQQSGWFDQ
jgi:hypothetical protein